MSLAVTFKDAMGALAVVITLVAYGIYVWQTLRGEARPHPLSWLIFGILTGTAYHGPAAQGALARAWRSPGRRRSGWSAGSTTWCVTSTRSTPRR